MMYTTEVFELEDQVVALAQKITNSQIAVTYARQISQLRKNPISRSKEQSFIAAKESFERIENYGKHAPDFNEKKRALRKAKRELDLDEQVSAFRISETAIQEILDQVGYKIASSISEDIKVSAGNPFFEMGKHSCEGSCHVG